MIEKTKLLIVWTSRSRLWPHVEDRSFEVVSSTYHSRRLLPTRVDGRQRSRSESRRKSSGLHRQLRERRHLLHGRRSHHLRRHHRRPGRNLCESGRGIIISVSLVLVRINVSRNIASDKEYLSACTFAILLNEPENCPKNCVWKLMKKFYKLYLRTFVAKLFYPCCPDPITCLHHVSKNHFLIYLFNKWYSSYGLKNQTPIYFLNFTNYYWIFDFWQLNESAHFPFQVLADPAPAHFVKMKTLTVTPSRQITRHEIPVMSNRLVRNFPNETFLIVSFCDETLTKLHEVR